MSAIAFDTHAFVKRLTAAGMPELQAEVLADEQRRLVDDKLAMKDDLAPLATKLDLADARTDIVKWMFGAMGFQSIVIIGSVVTLVHFLH